MIILAGIKNKRVSSAELTRLFLKKYDVLYKCKNQYLSQYYT